MLGPYTENQKFNKDGHQNKNKNIRRVSEKKNLRRVSEKKIVCGNPHYAPPHQMING